MVQYCRVLILRGFLGISLKKVSWVVVVVVVGGIAIIASSSRSRSDFEKDLEIEIFRDLEIWTLTQPGPFGPGPELDNYFVSHSIKSAIYQS